VLTQDIGGQAALSGDIENYTGYQFITGPELAMKFQEHMRAFAITVNMPEIVIDIQKEGNLIKTISDKSQYLSKAVIVATGKRPRMLSVAGEKEFKNKGVSYCATCDGPLFKDKTVAVIGGGNSALDAALALIRISPQVYIFNITSRLTADPIMVETLEKAPNAQIWNNTKVKAIKGDTFVKSIEVEKEGKTHSLAVEGVFVEIGLIPNSEFNKIVKHNELGEIVVDRHNCTNVEGIFAAGDVTDVVEKQIIIACGEGSKACLSAFKYLSTHRF
jgi:alkyl hydroperoxide reductase subunit F